MTVSLLSFRSFGDRFRRMLSRAIQLEMSQEEASRKLWESLREKYGDPLDEYGTQTPWVVETFDAYVIVEKGGEKFQIDYSFDGDAVVLGTPVPVEIQYQPKTDAETTAALSQPSPKGGEKDMNEEQKIQAARDEERAKLSAELAAQEEKIRLAREDERKRVLAEAARKEEVKQLAAKLTNGKFAFPQKPADLEAVLVQLSDADRALVTPLLESIHASGLVNLGEEGHAGDANAPKELEPYAKRLLNEWLGKKKTVTEFFAANPELGSEKEYDLSAFRANA